jgi:hypothetical protein
MNKRGIAMMIMSLMVLALMACEGGPLPGPGTTFANPAFTPSPWSGNNQDAAEYAAAQATLNAGQSGMMELSHQATVVSFNMNQAANAAAQAEVDDNQRRLMELSIQATEISQMMSLAAATQQYITEQTQIAWDAAATAQSQAATATYSAYMFNVTQTLQAQAMLDAQGTQTALAQATQTAYSLTATPFAALQADIVRTRDEAERRALWGEFVVTPLKVFLVTLVVLLLIAGGVITYQRLMPLLELRLRTISRYDDSPWLLVEGKIVDSDPQLPPLTQGEALQADLAQISSDRPAQVEIISPSEPSIINWITEAEQKLSADGRTAQR